MFSEDGAHSNMFKIFNGVKEVSVISPLLFTLFIDSLFLLLKQLGFGCHVGLTSLLDIHAPHRVITPRPNAPWYTNKVCESKRLRIMF